MQLNVLDDLPEAMKALDGRKTTRQREGGGGGKAVKTRIPV